VKVVSTVSTSGDELLEIVKQTDKPGSSVSLLAHQHGLTLALFFQWPTAYLEGSLIAVGAGENVAFFYELAGVM
jgi:transposase